MPVLLPKMGLKPEHDGLPIIFLLGPDFGGGDWQYAMYRRMLFHAEDRSLGDFVAAIPKRYPDDHPIRSHITKGTTIKYERQLFWERDLIQSAIMSANAGCVAVWLPEESKLEPRTDGEPYARDTRGELGEIRGLLRFVPFARVVIGAEPGFPGLRVIQDNFSHAVGHPFQFFDSLEDVARCSVRVAKRGLIEARRRSV